MIGLTICLSTKNKVITIQCTLALIGEIKTQRAETSLRRLQNVLKRSQLLRSNKTSSRRLEKDLGFTTS